MTTSPRISCSSCRTVRPSSRSRWSGLDAWNQLQRATFPLFRGFTLQLGEVYDCVDADTLIAEYRSEAIVVRNDNEYRNRYIGVFRFADGKIAAWKEFHNPEATSVL